MKYIILILTISSLINGCTQIVTAPIAVAGKIATTTIDIAGSAGGAIVNTVTGGKSNKD